MKKLLLFVLLFVFVVGACASPAPTTAPEVVCPECPACPVAEPEISVFQKAQNGVPFRWAHDNQSHPVARLMAAGFLQACEDFGLLCENMSVPDEDGAAVLSMMEQSIALGSSGQIFPIYLPEHYQQSQDMIDAGIPVVGVHFPVDSENVPGLLAWAAPDNVGYAIQAGYAMAEKVECEGPIGVTQSSLNDGENAVAKHFREAVLEKCPDIEVLDVQIEGFDQAAAILIASAIIQANPDLTGGFSTTGSGPTTWAKAAEENGKEPGEITIISMDYSRPNLDLVKSGEVYMLVGQPLFEEFYYAVVLLVSNMMGYPVPRENTLPAPMITVENVDRFYYINDLAEAVKVE